MFCLGLPLREILLPLRGVLGIKTLTLYVMDYRF